MLGDQEDDVIKARDEAENIKNSRKYKHFEVNAEINNMVSLWYV